MNAYLCSSLSYPNLAIPAKYSKCRSSIPLPLQNMGLRLRTHHFKTMLFRRGRGIELRHLLYLAGIARLGYDKEEHK